MYLVQLLPSVSGVSMDAEVCSHVSFAAMQLHQLGEGDSASDLSLHRVDVPLAVIQTSNQPLGVSFQCLIVGTKSVTQDRERGDASIVEHLCIIDVHVAG